MMTILCKHNHEQFPRDWHTVEMPINGISKEGQQLVRTYCAACAITVPPGDWDWHWLVTGKGEYVGTFPKRLGKLHYNTTGKKLSAELLSAVGSLASGHVDRAGKYHLRFVDTFDWNAGDYGDEGSCFWSCHAGAKDLLIENGAIAVQFRDDDEEGYARAWVVFHDGFVIVFNGYGLETLQIARILSHFWGAYYKRCNLSNHDDESGLLYINNGTGYAIGSQDQFSEYTPNFDLRYGDVPLRCDRCGECIDEEDSCSTPDDDLYCESCYNEHCAICECCGERIWYDYSIYIESQCATYCQSCFDDNYTHCQSCGEIVPAEDVVDIDNGIYCDHCTTTCEQCNSDILKSEAEEMDGQTLCTDCAEEYAVKAEEESGE